MPLWPVTLRPWTAGTIRRVVPREVLVEFDGPLTFTFTDTAGTLLLAHLLSRDGVTARYVAVPTTQDIVDGLKRGARPLRAALDLPLVWLMDVSPDGTVADVWAGSFGDLPTGVLPAADVMLYPHLPPPPRQRAVAGLVTS